METPDFDDEDGLMEAGCLFPGECCMPGFHLKAECHTAEMMEVYLDDDAAIRALATKEDGK